LTAFNQNFSVYSGVTKSIVVSVTKENNAPLDITGSQITWSFNNVLKTNANGITLTNPTQGEFTIHLDSNDTQNMQGRYYHKAIVTDAIGNVSIVTTGKITVEKQPL
jgi:hypothetical protein